MEQLIILIIFIALGYGAGTYAEKKHYQSIEKREHNYLKLPAVTNKNLLDSKAEIAYARLVTGSAVISIDYFKRILAGLRNVFGGEVSSYETLVDRARREAILRMKEHAANGNAAIVLNVRIETSAIGQSANRRKAIGSVEALAYGTAVTYRELG